MVELGGDLVNELTVLHAPRRGDVPAPAFGVEGLVEKGREVLLGPAFPSAHFPEKVFVDFGRQPGIDTSVGVHGFYIPSLVRM
jgi:hypothetical protein